jgi:hypothetical protein
MIGLQGVKGPLGGVKQRKWCSSVWIAVRWRPSYHQGLPPKRHIDKKPSLFIDKKEKRHKEIEQSLKL